MVRVSANLGFLWTDCELPDAIRAAAAAGFDAVECHMPYATPPAQVREALNEAGLSMVSLNTRIGDPSRGELGVAALPGREGQARGYIDEALQYAHDIDCPAISVVAGRSGRTPEAESTYRKNLAYAAGAADRLGTNVLIEPLNPTVADDYHLVTVDQGIETIRAVGAPNLMLMIDCFHASISHGELGPVFDRAIEYVGHVQFASIPDRTEPCGGTVDYAELLPWIETLGYSGCFGAEYNPAGSVEDGLGWLATIKERWK